VEHREGCIPCREGLKPPIFIVGRFRDDDSRPPIAPFQAPYLVIHSKIPSSFFTMYLPPFLFQ
jgi:hypothetical protein